MCVWGLYAIYLNSPTCSLSSVITGDDRSLMLDVVMSVRPHARSPWLYNVISLTKPLMGYKAELHNGQAPMPESLISSKLYQAMQSYWIVSEMEWVASEALRP
ncbi:hypothetical protein IAQ61_000024 [Plenodomus lingam]|uniref:uncharacterized protein n=1 Tax=Leptosphaeria maculans TaxID=5022 RepID=UPI0033344B7C|nr:hypothetical protein IAQ61_000024 [Plenodomus lingam]